MFNHRVEGLVEKLLPIEVFIKAFLNSFICGRHVIDLLAELHQKYDVAGLRLAISPLETDC